MTQKKAEPALICLAAIIGARGVGGEMRVKTFTQDPLALASYGALCSENGDQLFEICDIRPHKQGASIKIKGINSREQAHALKGTRLFIKRAQLPELDESGDFYHADLIGLKARAPDGTMLGTVTAVHNFGAGDMLEIAGGLVQFTKKNVPHIDIQNGFLELSVPPDVGSQKEEQKEEQI